MTYCLAMRSGVRPPLLRCELVVASSGEYLSQLFTGFGALRRSGAIQAVVRRDRRDEDFDPDSLSTRLDVVLNGCWRLVYDMRDSGSIHPRHGIGIADVYFKRSYGSEAIGHPSAERIYPLGLNYAVYGPGDWTARRLWWMLAGIRPSNAKATAVRMAKLSRPLSRALRADAGRSSCWVDRFTAEPAASESPRVLLLTRVYEPADPATADEWRELNAMRARCIRLLRGELGPDFVGGLVPSDHARREYPDCVVDRAPTRKANYLRTLKECDICVTTKGLSGSNGWRLAEYVAASRAIVAERLRYGTPGGFSHGKNYLEFGIAEECVERVVALVEDAGCRRAMMWENRRYYESFVRPDSFVRNSLAAAATHLGIREIQPLVSDGRA
jgi:hypothetical protein